MKEKSTLSDPSVFFLPIKKLALNSGRRVGSISTSACSSSIVELNECGNKL